MDDVHDQPSAPEPPTAATLPGVLARTLLLHPIAAAVALGNWWWLIELGGWPRAGLIVVSVIALLLLRWQAGRRPSIAWLLALPHAAAVGLALSATVSFGTELVPEPIAWQGIAVPCAVLAIATVGTLAGVLRPSSRWPGVALLLIATAGLYAIDRQTEPRRLLLPVLDADLLVPAEAPDTGADPDPVPDTGSTPDETLAIARTLGMSLFCLYVIVIYPIEITAELRRTAAAARAGRLERAWHPAMGLVFSVAWFWLSLIVAAASGGGGRDDPHHHEP